MKKDIKLSNNTNTNFNNIESNFTDLYNNKVSDITIDNVSIVSEQTASLITVQNSDIDSLFKI